MLPRRIQYATSPPVAVLRWINAWAHERPGDQFAGLVRA
jgi:hypothetical protein